MSRDVFPEPDDPTVWGPTLNEYIAETVPLLRLAAVDADILAANLRARADRLEALVENRAAGTDRQAPHQNPER